MNEIETVYVELVISLRHVERIDGDFRVFEAMTGRLRDRSKHFHRIELNASRMRGLKGTRNDELGRIEKRGRT